LTKTEAAMDSQTKIRISPNVFIISFLVKGGWGFEAK
jgi:hypothetical protein